MNICKELKFKKIGKFSFEISSIHGSDLSEEGLSDLIHLNQSNFNNDTKQLFIFSNITKELLFFEKVNKSIFKLIFAKKSEIIIQDGFESKKY